VTRGAPLAPSSHSSKATRLTMRAPSLAPTRRLSPHAEHVSSRGRVSAATRPTWPQGHVTRISMESHPKNSPGRTGAESHCTTKLKQAPHYLAYTVRADGARRPRGRRLPRHLNTALRKKMPMPMSTSSTRMRRISSIITRTKKGGQTPAAPSS
jgi:hypothetical protein